MKSADHAAWLAQIAEWKKEYALCMLPVSDPEEVLPQQVLEELENNPRKYPAWRELSAAMKANVAEEEKLKAAAQSALRQRILREKTGGGAQGASTTEK